jgi:hypothetical protein
MVPFRFDNMKQIMRRPDRIHPEHAKYEDSEFSDKEIEAFMRYFRVRTYEALKSIIATMKRSGLGF